MQNTVNKKEHSKVLNKHSFFYYTRSRLYGACNIIIPCMRIIVMRLLLNQSVYIYIYKVSLTFVQEILQIVGI